MSFGNRWDQQDMLSPIRIGFGVSPVSWFTVYSMAQDSRVPFYGTTAPNTVRDTLDLQETYVKFLDVVADEVCNPAQRSAEAANEDRRFDWGDRASQEGCRSLESVAGSIGKVTGHAKKIASLLDGVKSGSDDQSRVQQIAAAIVRIGQVTQSSASRSCSVSTPAWVEFRPVFSKKTVSELK